MYKEDLALNNLRWLICHKAQPNHIYLIYMYKKDLALNNLQWLICHKTQLDKTKNPNSANCMFWPIKKLQFPLDGI